MGSSSNVANLLNPKSSLKKFTLSSYPFFALLVAALILIYFYTHNNTSSKYNPFSASHIDPLASPNSTEIPPPPQDPPPCQGVLDNSSAPQTTCEYNKGEWVPTKLEPLYNGTTCGTIKQGQNCFAYGRPDRDYLYWRWKPQQCDLPRFDPNTFLELIENKHIAFVGDSLARNQLESMLCMMATVSKPNLYYTDGDNRFRKWHFPSHNINVSVYWSPFLVKVEQKSNEKNYNTVYLDLVEERWAGDLGVIDTLVLTSGQWYLQPTVYQYGNQVLGCHALANCTEIGFYDVYGKALRRALQAVIEREGWQTGNFMHVFLTTFPPAHFEGDWDKLGSCSRTQPYKAGEQILQGMNEEMRRIGVEQMEEAKIKSEKFGRKLRLGALDVTGLALLRPDGHPGPYMNPFPFANGVSDRVQNDCVHWCLPGPIDTWNEILLQMIKNWAS